MVVTETRTVGKRTVCILLECFLVNNFCPASNVNFRTKLSTKNREGLFVLAIQQYLTVIGHTWRRMVDRGWLSNNQFIYIKPQSLSAVEYRQLHNDHRGPSVTKYDDVCLWTDSGTVVDAALSRSWCVRRFDSLAERPEKSVVMYRISCNVTQARGDVNKTAWSNVNTWNTWPWQRGGSNCTVTVCGCKWDVKEERDMVSQSASHSRRRAPQFREKGAVEIAK